MAVRIRVYPAGAGALGAAGMYGQGGAVSAQTYFTQKLQTQQQVSNLRLNYERALWNERLDKVRLEERLKNPYAAYGTGMAGAYGGLPIGGVPIGGMPIGGLLGGVPFGGVGLGGLPMGGVPTAFGGSGQTNGTTQSALGAANQSVSNANTYNVVNSLGGLGRFGFGGGGLLSGILGALI